MKNIKGMVKELKSRYYEGIFHREKSDSPDVINIKNVLLDLVSLSSVEKCQKILDNVSPAFFIPKVCGMPIDKVSEYLGIKVATVSSLLNRNKDSVLFECARFVSWTELCSSAKTVRKVHGAKCRAELEFEDGTRYFASGNHLKVIDPKGVLLLAIMSLGLTNKSEAFCISAYEMFSGERKADDDEVAAQVSDAHPRQVLPELSTDASLLESAKLFVQTIMSMKPGTTISITVP